MTDNTPRLCGPTCPTPDLTHLPAEPDWIGNYPIYHGESDHKVPGTGGWNGTYAEAAEMYCLCGHPSYQLCPEWWFGGGIGGLTIARDEDGVVGFAEDPTFPVGGNTP